MAQEGRGKKPSLPESFFEIDELDTAWDTDEPSGIELMREPSRNPEPTSEVQAASVPPVSDVPCEGPDAVEETLPLIHPDTEVQPVRASPRPTRTRQTGDPERRTTPGDPLLNEVRDRYAMGDYSGALVIADGILANDPDHAQARRYADNCRQILEQMYCAKLGSLTRRPEVTVAGDQLRWLSLDHRAGFLLSLIDGTSSVEELLDISGMPRFEALRTLCDLLEQNVITLAS